MDRVRQGQFISQVRVSGVSTYGVATPRPLNASLPFRCTLKGTRDTLLKNHPYAVGETMQVNGVHGSDQLEASLNPQEAAGEGTAVLPSPQGCVVQYMRGTNVQNAGVTNVVNIQDSQGSRGGLEGV